MHSFKRNGHETWHGHSLGHWEWSIATKNPSGKHKAWGSKTTEALHGWPGATQRDAWLVDYRIHMAVKTHQNAI